MTFFAVLLILMWVLDTLRLRGRLAALPCLKPNPEASDDPADPQWVLVALPGVELSPAVHNAVAAYAQERDLLGLDLVPNTLHVEGLMGLLALVDPSKEGETPFGTSASACHALMVRADRVPKDPPKTGPELQQAFRQLRAHAPGQTAHLRVPELLALRPDPVVSPAVRRGQFYRFLGPLLAFQVWMFVLLGACVLLTPRWGIAALAIFQLQPLLVTVGQMPARGSFLAALIRVPWHLLAILRAALDAARPDPEVEALRPAYSQAIAGGLDPFFEERRSTCPLCDSADIPKRLRTRDLHQHKPGEFQLDRCRDCGHIFQNPRLSLKGLDYYYRDFYDGLGARAVDAVFALAGSQYEDRASMLKGQGRPKRWLDVGGGHGHFCYMAQELWPETRFEALDLSSSVEEAEQRGWVAKGWRGLFPELAQELGSQDPPYDVISMSHYMEHTRDPALEVATAASLLPPGGFLMIELPDPESKLQYLVGKRWMPWFQPQHQHFVSVPNLTRICAQHGLSLEVEHRAQAHQSVDVFAACWMVVNALAPETVPWQPRPGPLRPLRNALVHLFVSWILLPAAATDVLLTPLARRTSNTYRVLYRKAPAS